MIKLIWFLIIGFFLSSFSIKNSIPEEINQFSQEVIEASINTYPMVDFYQTYFDQSVPQEYIDNLMAKAVIWRGLEHKIELRSAQLTYKNEGKSEYLLKYWVTFKDNRKFSYSISVFEQNGKMTLHRFEPNDVDVINTFYSARSSFDIPDVRNNVSQIIFALAAIVLSLIAIIVLAIRRKNYLLLITIPLLFIYKKSMTIFNFEGIEIITPKTYFGLPLLQNIDLYFTSISLLSTGVLYAWAIIVVILWTKLNDIASISRFTILDSTR
ncbi:hypothetical protein ACFOUP_00480 [Belliella kenyensis]|uniref:Uncharacterized protein n=1 Tax=Belliella kenyensis TaxID=1472724 RepID=A0ABV8EGS6_9BACT|nr:hypothetical protein [Belliella kenyensis]MCH7401836.1 hypothetical protein [Belliella kenyensis]MDN3604336.1 hypothetical protein [Belliella kenyensis]